MDAQPSMASQAQPAMSTAAQTGPAAGPSSATWWSRMSCQVNQHLQVVQQHMQRMSLQVQTASKTWKPPDLSKGLGMKVDVDWLNPALTGLMQQWQQLPEPVREVMPYAGVAFAAGVSVQRFYNEQLQVAHQRYGHLRDDHTMLQQQFKQLEAQWDDITTRRTGALLEIQMAEAVAKATTAAATAAAAAAAAAEACNARPPGNQQQRR